MKDKMLIDEFKHKTMNQLVRVLLMKALKVHTFRCNTKMLIMIRD
ncbi:hypothetical protein RRG54_00970 [Mycoplasmopsis felis]